jgi:transcriptional regulator with XRE-family HTH domain
MAEIEISPVEEFRRKLGLTQRELAARLHCADTLVGRAERGGPIRRKYVERYIQLSDGLLSEADFNVAGPKRKSSNGN